MRSLSFLSCRDFARAKAWGCGLLSCLLLASGCARRETPAQKGIREQVLYLGNASEPRDLDPHVVTSYNDFNIVAAKFIVLTISPAPFFIFITFIGGYCYQDFY